jgi:chorismate mutase
MSCRAVRGAITVASNTEAEIVTATKELLLAIVENNQINPADIVSILFTVTKDLNAQFPANAAHVLDWKLVPMLCSYEIEVKKSLRKCIRIMLTFNTAKNQNQIKHQYLREALKLRPDLMQSKE